jgi:hypothetical protein
VVPMRIIRIDEDGVALEFVSDANR